MRKNRHLSSETLPCIKAIQNQALEALKVSLMHIMSQNYPSDYYIKLQTLVGQEKFSTEKLQVETESTHLKWSVCAMSEIWTQSFKLEIHFVIYKQCKNVDLNNYRQAATPLAPL